MSERIAYQFNGDHVLKFSGMQKLTGEQIVDELNRLYTIIAEQNEEIAALEREVEPWIPVSERMPDPWVEVRFYPEVVTEPVIDRGVFDNQGRCWYDEYVPYSGAERVERKGVTHWQPITPPKEQSDE